MSYRYYIATMDKEKAEEISRLPLQWYLDFYTETYGGDTYIKNVVELPTVNVLYEIGSYVDEGLLDGVYERKGFFLDKELLDYMEGTDYEIHLTSKKRFIKLVQNMQSKIANHYKKMLTIDDWDKMRFGEDVTVESKLKHTVQRRMDMWSNPNLTKQLVPKHNNTLHYLMDAEYEIFNYIYLLKTIDWNNKEVIIIGY